MSPKYKKANIDLIYNDRLFNIIINIFINWPL